MANLVDYQMGRAQRIGEEARIAYRLTAPQDQGQLVDSLLVSEPRRDGARITFELSVDDQRTPYGKWQDDPPAEIRPVHAKALVWADKATGGLIFAQRVRPSRVNAGWFSTRFHNDVDQLMGRI